MTQHTRKKKELLQLIQDGSKQIKKLVIPKWQDQGDFILFADLITQKGILVLLQKDKHNLTYTGTKDAIEEMANELTALKIPFEKG